MTKCFFRDNHATGAGLAGGALTVRGVLHCANNVFLSNSSAGNGGAVAIDNNPDAYIQELVHSTFAENVAAGDGGAVWAQGDATASVISAYACIFWGNLALGGGADQIGEEFPGVFDLVECDIQGGWPAGLKNLDVDPLFVVERDALLSTATPLEDLATYSSMVCSYFPGDVDGQARRCNSSEIGADEIGPVTLALGLPTQPLRAVGVCGVAPHSPVTLIVSPAMAASPLATPFGSLEVVANGAVLVPFPPADTNGVSLVEVGLASLPAGTNIALQALAGGQLAPATTLLVR